MAGTLRLGITVRRVKPNILTADESWVFVCWEVVKIYYLLYLELTVFIKSKRNSITKAFPLIINSNWL